MSLIKTPTGDISFKSVDGKITGLTWGKTFENEANEKRIEMELNRYFGGTLKEFSFLSSPEGTDFQKNVWNYLLTIPYGEVKTYKDVAQAVGSHPRAVGGAIGKNPIPIVIPCHRVIATSGKMCGFSGGEGIKTKEILLNLEQKYK